MPYQLPPLCYPQFGLYLYYLNILLFYFYKCLLMYLPTYVHTYICTDLPYLPTNFNLLINLYHMFNYLCLASANYQFIYLSFYNICLPTHPPYQPTPTYLSSLPTYTYLPILPSNLHLHTYVFLHQDTYPSRPTYLHQHHTYL